MGIRGRSSSITPGVVAPPSPIGGPITNDDWTEGVPDESDSLRTVIFPKNYRLTVCTLSLTGYSDIVDAGATINSAALHALAVGAGWPVSGTSPTTVEVFGDAKIWTFRFDSNAIAADPGRANTDFV